MRTFITSGDQQSPAGAVLLYEAEWNEFATADQHRAAVEYFADVRGVHVDPVSDLGPDDVVWIIPGEGS